MKSYDKNQLITLYYLVVRYIDLELKLRDDSIKTKNKEFKEIELVLLGAQKMHKN